MRLTNIKNTIREDNPIQEVKRCANTQTRISKRGLSQEKIVSRSFLRYCDGAKKKVFCEDTGIHVFGDAFLGFLIGVITWVVH